MEKLKEVYNKIMDILDELPGVKKEKNIYIGILIHLKTPEKALIMLDYLEKNKDNQKLMRDDFIIEKSLEIMYNN